MLLGDRGALVRAAAAEGLAAPRGVGAEGAPAVALLAARPLLAAAAAEDAGLEADGVRGLTEAALDQGVRALGVALVGAGEDGQGPTCASWADTQLVTAVAPHVLVLHALPAAVRARAVPAPAGAVMPTAGLGYALPAAGVVLAVVLPALVAVQEPVRGVPP